MGCGRVGRCYHAKKGNLYQVCHALPCADNSHITELFPNLMIKFVSKSLCTFLLHFGSICQRRAELPRMKTVQVLDVYHKIIFQVENRHSSKDWMSVCLTTTVLTLCISVYFFFIQIGKKCIFLICISLITGEVEPFIFHMFISHLYFLSREFMSLLLKGRVSFQGLAREKMLCCSLPWSPGGKSCSGRKEGRASWDCQVTLEFLNLIGAFYAVSLQSTLVHCLFIRSVKKQFGFLREALHIPLKPVLIILSGQTRSMPIQFFFFFFSSVSPIGSWCIAVDLA